MEMKMPFFYKKREQEGKTDPVLGGVLVGRGGSKERRSEDEYGGNILYTCM
jgi:hypothetical protein